MKPETTRALLRAIQNHPAILRAAITGSQARNGAGDQFSDLDVLLVARDVGAVRQFSTWMPYGQNILICASHLSHYCTILMDDFKKLDLAIFGPDDPPSKWVVHDYVLVKGDTEFENQLARAAVDTRSTRAAHLNPDVCMDNVLLLLFTAFQRVNRAEQLSAHAFLAMAADMLVSVERKQGGVEADDDVLDPRRRLERNQRDLAQALHESLFVAPDRGITRIAQYVATRHRESMPPGQLKVLHHLLGVNNAS
jgi:predicted nucleotidyltransferase